MSDLDELRQKRLRELALMQQQAHQEKLQEHTRASEINQQIDLIVHKILTPDALQRLGNIRVARPEFARQVEILLIQLYQAGKLPAKVDDSLLKNILTKISSQKKEIRITK
ncbi:MAG: DNA-binding protein [Candidatus Altiarchaeota archaeon]|nr:DNA-binding protein [Candidatus Altiarchaeota archaeon]